MALNSLKDVYIDQLQDLSSACKQSLDATVQLGRAASDDALQRALNDGASGISRGMDQIASLCAEHGASPTGEHCKGMEGLVKEAEAHAIEGDFGDDAARFAPETLPDDPPEVRLRLAVRAGTEAAAAACTQEVLALYCCGPAGGGGQRSRVTRRLETRSCLYSRRLVREGYRMV